ncbi:START-like domain-containing protein [Paramyrothecium foliicola]|nr:START-like domain-containing protein [Paramyrothecium foliicola]
MTKHHDTFKALSPIDWGQVPQDNLKEFLDDIFADAQTVIESIPSQPAQGESTGRARSKTDSAVGGPDLKASLALRPSQDAIAHAAQLRKEWKEVKVNPRENPLGISVYKLSAKDGKGAWFARRSTHEGLDFDKWKLGLEREFHESMKVQGGPGSGNIRGIGAERRVEHQSVDNVGQLDVYQLSAQFPGPTSPRDFITLFLTSDFSHKATDNPQPLRQYMIVSKPCNHPDTPTRQGIIRGQYESVEVIREVLIDHASAKRSLSSADLANSAKEQGKIPHDPKVAIEWLMVTRSDPGGSVPRFMIERGTPPGIVGDAGKFLDWIKSKSTEDLSNNTEETGETPTATPVVESRSEPTISGIPTATQPTENKDRDTESLDLLKPESSQEESSGYSSLYGMITGAFAVATSVATGLRRQLVTPVESFAIPESLAETPPVPRQFDSSDKSEKKEPVETPDEIDSSSEVSSIHSFTSALEGRDADAMSQESLGNHSDDSKSLSNNPHEKELRKIQERRRKIDEKVAKMQERIQTKRHEESEKDAAAQVKAREKHEKEIAKQEAKYKRELQRLEQKREQEQRKAEEKRRKAAEREDKSKLSLELERTKAERDYARKQIQLLQSQVGELQAQNTLLVAKLGRLGGSDSSSSPDVGLGNQVVSPAAP